MKRRTMLKRIGAVGATGIAVSSSASASTSPQLNIDREIDVADMSGTVPLKSVLSEAEIEDLPSDVDPETAQISIAEDADSIQPSGCCYGDCTIYCADRCHHGCCFC